MRFWDPHRNGVCAPVPQVFKFSMVTGMTTSTPGASLARMFDRPPKPVLPDSFEIEVLARLEEPFPDTSTAAGARTLRLNQVGRAGVVVTVALTEEADATAIAILCRASGKLSASVDEPSDWSHVRADYLHSNDGRSDTRPYVVVIPLTGQKRYMAQFPIAGHTWTSALVWVHDGDATGVKGRVYMQRWV